MPGDTTRASLLIRARDRQDRAAWLRFDFLYRPLLYRFAQTMGLSGCDCEDVVQQCFRRISEHIGTFEYDRSVGRFRSWLKVIAANEVRKHFRDRAPASAPQECLTVIPALGDDPEEVFERHWMREHLWHCVRQMRAEVDEPTYAAFHAYVFEETSIDDICAKLNMNPAQVYNIKSRLTRHVARKMRKFFGEEA